MFKFFTSFLAFFSAKLLPLLSRFSRKERDRCPGEWDRTMLQLPFPSFVTLMSLSLSFFFCNIGMTIFALLWGLIEGAHIKQPTQSWKCNNHTLAAILRPYFFPSSPSSHFTSPPYLSILCLILYLLSIEKCGLTTSHLLSTMLGTEEKTVPWWGICPCHHQLTI